MNTAMKKAIITGIEVKYGKRGEKLEECGYIDADIMYSITIGKDNLKHRSQAIVHIDGDGWPDDVSTFEVQNQDSAMDVWFDYLARVRYPKGLQTGDALSLLHDKHLEIVQAISKKEPYSIRL